MIKKPFFINRREFLAQTIITFGSSVLGYASDPFLNSSKVKSGNQANKKLLATTDYLDNVLINKSFMDKTQLDQLHSYLASLGVTRHQWMFDTNWTYYDNYPHGFDLLKEAVKSAHAHGIEFYAIIKPFEESGCRPVLPHSLPFPQNAQAFKDIRGIKPYASAFAAQNLEMNLRRRPGSFEFQGPVSSIRLVKKDDKPTGIQAKHLSLFTSPTNNAFEPYKGPLSFRESVEWRVGFPKGRKCRILNLENLELPANHRHILIKCSLDENGNFSNEISKIIELEGPDGKAIPCTHSTGPVTLETDEARFYNLMKIDDYDLIPYFALPELKKELNDPEKMRKHYQNFYNYDRYNVTDSKSLDKDGFIAVVCGKPEYLLGNLHPIYAEVREHWLEMTRYCLDRGVDGINFRAANHSQDPEAWEYGFNEPAIKAAGGKTDYPTIKRINGDAYTKFLRQARELIKSRGKSITVHIFAQMLAPDDRHWRLSYLPPNFDWQWETWVNEIADDLEFRGVYTLRPWHAKQVLETILSVTQQADKALYFQDHFHETTFDGPNYRLSKDLEMMYNYPEIAGFCLYETAAYTRLNEKGNIEGSSDIKSIIGSQFKQGTVE